MLRTGFAEPAGIFGWGILPQPKTPHIHVRRPAGFTRRLRRSGGAPENQRRNGNSNSDSDSKSESESESEFTTFWI
ncbi:hypothetical protein [Luteimonas mephitis]|uniref:hypothetical protein n=1 Tax=Luteimonas mephitis TaxID=83615 RepID=UPI0012EBD33F|nr:hypothetical protein [Luteimonas mephitis]